MVQKIIFYTDYASFGGHEIMSVEHAVIWSKIADIEFYIHKDNKLLLDYIEINKYNLIFKVNIYKEYIKSKFEIFNKNIKDYNYINITDSILILVAGGVGSCILGYKIGKQFKAKKIYWYLPMILVPKSLLSYIYFRFILFVYKDVITITKFQARRLLRYNKNINITILRNFIPKNKIKYEFKNFESNNYNIIKLSFIGRIHKQKNILSLINAINYYYATKINSNFEVELKLIGCDEKSDIFKNLLHYVNGGWKIIGIAWSSKPYDNYMDGLLLPSKYEGDPLVIHECRLRRIPVFCQNLEELDDILYDSEKINFNNKNLILDITRSYNYCKREAKNISKIEHLQNYKFTNDSQNFLRSLIENTNN